MLFRKRLRGNEKLARDALECETPSSPAVERMARQADCTWKSRGRRPDDRGGASAGRGGRALYLVWAGASTARGGGASPSKGHRGSVPVSAAPRLDGVSPSQGGCGCVCVCGFVGRRTQGRAMSTEFGWIRSVEFVMALVSTGIPACCEVLCTQDGRST